MKLQDEKMGECETISNVQSTFSAKVDATPESGILYAKLATQPPRAIGGKGIYIHTDDGREILDASCGAAVACLGHNNPRVKEAIMRQLDNVAYCYAPFFTTSPAEELAKQLCESTGWQMSRVFIVSSGTLISLWIDANHTDSQARHGGSRGSIEDVQAVFSGTPRA